MRLKSRISIQNQRKDISRIDSPKLAMDSGIITMARKLPRLLFKNLLFSIQNTFIVYYLLFIIVIYVYNCY